jgi:hypothetical protein
MKGPTSTRRRELVREASTIPISPPIDVPTQSMNGAPPFPVSRRMKLALGPA